MVATELQRQRPGSAPEHRKRPKTAPESAPSGLKRAPDEHRRRTGLERPDRHLRGGTPGAPGAHRGRTGSASALPRNAPADDPTSFTRTSRAPPSATDSPHGRTRPSLHGGAALRAPAGREPPLPTGPGDRTGQPESIHATEPPEPTRPGSPVSRGSIPAPPRWGPAAPGRRRRGWGRSRAARR
jgi:hypothetical protein